ncbi:MAG: hypothetical protein Fur005_17010 [Roseiflexaceae bacterium]
MAASARIRSITHGAEFEIDLARFTEPLPIFAYVDDLACQVDHLDGLTHAGLLRIDQQAPFMWLQGPRNCTKLIVNEAGQQQRRATFRSLAVGEFCYELYHVAPDGTSTRLLAGDFTFK